MNHRYKTTGHAQRMRERLTQQRNATKLIAELEEESKRHPFTALVVLIPRNSTATFVEADDPQRRQLLDLALDGGAVPAGLVFASDRDGGTETLSWNYHEEGCDRYELCNEGLDRMAAGIGDWLAMGKAFPIFIFTILNRLRRDSETLVFPLDISVRWVAEPREDLYLMSAMDVLPRLVASRPKTADEPVDFPEEEMLRAALKSEGGAEVVIRDSGKARKVVRAHMKPCTDSQQPPPETA
jgi:hypothetical protein